MRYKIEDIDPVKVYVVYLDGKPLSRSTHRKVAYLEPSSARATVTVLAKKYARDNCRDYWDKATTGDIDRLIEIEKARFEIRIFTDSNEVIC